MRGGLRVGHSVHFQSRFVAMKTLQGLLCMEGLSQVLSSYIQLQNWQC